MINFFRKIRQRLLTENKFSKYLLYAIGEIVLVVIGILIALQVNNLNEDRKERKVEVRLLNELITGLSNDLSTLRYNIDKHSQAVKSSEIVLNALNDNQEFADSLAYHFAAVHYYTGFNSSRGAYESLKSTGFGIISNESLRYGLINYYDEWNNVLKGNSKNIREDIQHLKRNFNQDYFDKFHLFNPTPPHYQGEMIPNDFQQLKRNKAYKYHIRTLHSGHSAFNGLNEISVNKVEELINHCQEELTRLK